MSGGATTYSDRAIEPGMNYSYTVTAQSDAGNSLASDPVAASIPAAPTAPEGLTATAAEPALADTSASITITWQPATAPEADACAQAFPVNGYTVERVQDGAATALASLGPDAGSFTDTGAFGTEYTYRMTAKSDIGNSPQATATLTTPLRPVGTPTGLTAGIADPFDGTVNLSWSAPASGAEVTGYRVSKTTGSGNAETLAENHPDTGYGDSTAEAGYSHWYTVQAMSADNSSNESQAAAIEPPAPPTGMSATARDGTIELSWKAPSRGTTVSYTVERQESGGDWTALTGTTETSHADNTATPDVTYTYRVQHRNQHGGSTWTESSEIMLLAVPGKPTGFSVTTDDNDNVLNWTAPASSIIDGYQVRHRISDGDWHSLAEDLTETGYRHNDAQADVTHNYAVQARNSAGNGPWSDTASATQVTPPGTPDNISAELDGDDILLTWTRPDSVHISGYTVRHRAGGADHTESALLPESQTSYRVSDVTGDVAYQLAVKAHNDGGESPWSDDAEITRLLPPGAPTGVTAAADDVNITLSWNAPATGTVHGYHVSYGDTASGQWTTVDADASDTSVHSRRQRRGNRLPVPGPRPQQRRQQPLVQHRDRDAHPHPRRAHQRGRPGQRKRHPDHLDRPGGGHHDQLPGPVRNRRLRHHRDPERGLRRNVLRTYGPTGRHRLPVPGAVGQCSRKQQLDGASAGNAGDPAPDPHRRHRRNQRR